MAMSLKKNKKRLDIRIKDFEKNFNGKRGYTKPGSMRK